VPQTDVLGTDDSLYPKSEQEHAELVTRVQEMFIAAESARKPYELKWKRFYKLFRSYVQRRQGDWRSKVFLPHVFFVIMTILPRLTAALPKMLAYPMEETDVDSANTLEELMEWAAQRSDLEMALITQQLESLIYGTGILKTKVIELKGFRMNREPVMNPIELAVEQAVMDPETQQPLVGLDGQEMTETVNESIGDAPQLDDEGNPVYEMSKADVLLYRGPAAEPVDLFNFYVAPEATSIDDARYVIQRYWRSRDYIEQQVKAGAYKRPDHVSDEDWSQAMEDPKFDRAADVGLSGQSNDPTRKAHKIDEVWTDERVITVMDQRFILRVAENPYIHGQKPYIRTVDHLDPHCFWGIGEVEALEGLQDLMNALVNARIDNVKLLFNAMFIMDPDAVQDLRDLQIRPGGVIRVRSKDGLPVKEFLQRLDLGDVTASSFEETGEAERLMEKISGVNGYTSGGETTEGMNQTATGAAIISDQGNSRFSHKVRMAEITGYRRLAHQFGTLLQQYMPDEMTVRIQGPNGKFSFKPLTPESIAGGFDFDIEAESTTTTDTIRKDQSMSLFQTLAGVPGVNVDKLVEDLLVAFGKKDLESYKLQQMPMVDPATGMPMDPNAQIDPTTGQPLPTGQPDALAPPPVEMTAVA
jgi:hypothetical protein